MELQTAKHTGSARCSDFFHNLMPACIARCTASLSWQCPGYRNHYLPLHDSVRLGYRNVYLLWLCWRFVVMTVPFTQEIKFKHLRNNSQLDKYHSIDIVRDQSAEFNYSNLKTWPRDVIDCHCWSTRVSKLQQPCLCFIPSTYIIQN